MTPTDPTATAALRRHCHCGNVWDEPEGECPACGSDDYEITVMRACPECGAGRPLLRSVDDGNRAQLTCRVCATRYEQAL